MSDGERECGTLVAQSCGLWFLTRRLDEVGAFVAPQYRSGKPIVTVFDGLSIGQICPARTSRN